MDNTTIVILCLAVCAGLFIYALISQKKQKNQLEQGYMAALPGTTIVTVSGLIGMVKEHRDDALIIDASPDLSGSLIEVEKAGFLKIYEGGEAQS